MTHVRKNTVSYALLVAICIFQFGVFEQSNTNPIGIRYTGELYLAICLGFTTLFMLSTPGFRRNDYNIGLAFCFFSAFTFVLLPALFAELFYRQPLFFGLIEERRVLYCFSFVLLLYFSKRVSAAQFESIVLAVGLLSVILSWMFYFKMLPDLRDEVLDLSRPGRASPGAGAIIFSYCFCVYFAGKGRSPINGALKSKLLYAFLAFVFLATIVFVMQTRQVIVVCAVFTLLVLKSQSIKPIVFGSLILFPLMANPHLLEALGLNIDFYMNSVEEGPTDDVRGNTITAIMNHLDEYNWVPSGSLSLMWNGGFRQYFSNYFFLSDVGVIGTIFRFGFLAFAIIPIALFIHYKAAIKLNSNLDFTLAVFLAFLTIWPLQGIFEYQGTTAFLLVVQALKTHHQRVVSSRLEEAPMIGSSRYRYGYVKPSLG
ncbi:hypothetical protein IQ22_03882 [Pseudomonas duriflava]|uniref:O-antigen ligase-like membrane protein n=1 Tax=Pseudomonas duriflava TaxID=459528 RepID=A0A562Q1G8_9PSED|nr:hypothetical protein [Pseudomonas duriflava]TWI50488.1 hypothetical protein IQ22_03882 [Pseudomonas duriflava]